MSVPKNHHIISKVHIKNFFNSFEGKIYVYDKIQNNIFYKSTLKSLFSEEYSNSRFSDGYIDHETLEKELNDFFERDFAKNVSIVQQFISDNNQNHNKEIINALRYFVKYGIIAEMRTSKHKEEVDEAVFGTLKGLSEMFSPELKADFERVIEFQNHVKYSNLTSYIEIADQILEKMGDLRYEILVADQFNYFFIPDFGAATQRDKINEYFNPDIKEIAYVGLALTSKIFINFYSTKLYKDRSIPSSSIIYCEFNAVEYFNRLNLRYCQSKVASENEEYLKKFVERNSTIA
jgi:hypothetical protein